MLGLMQHAPLLISTLIEHAAAFHPEAEIVVRTVEGPLLRTNYATVRRRAKRLPNALGTLAIAQSDRVGTLAWNTHRHLELYFGASGSGAVLHTVNPRLFPEQIEYIVNHAQDKVLFLDISFAALVEKLAPALRTVNGRSVRPGHAAHGLAGTTARFMGRAGSGHCSAWAHCAGGMGSAQAWRWRDLFLDALDAGQSAAIVTAPGSTKYFNPEGAARSPLTPIP